MRRFLVLCLLFASAVLVLVVPSSAFCMGEFSPAMAKFGFLHEEQSRFLPGDYYFGKGNDYWQRGDTAIAIQQWTIAAGWAQKEAQYNLGLAYLKGGAILADRPRGLAWLALAAERKDARFSESLAAAWDEASPDEHDQANRIWRELRVRYADAFALPIARRRFDRELAEITGSRVGMPGHVSIITAHGAYEGSLLKKAMNAAAQSSFGREPRASVDVGPVQGVDEEAKPAGQR